MFQSVAATPALVTPPSRRLNRCPLGPHIKCKIVHNKCRRYTFKYHTRSTLSRSLSGAGLLNCFAGHTHAPITRPLILPHHNHFVHARIVTVTLTAGGAREKCKKSRDHRPSRTTHTKDGTTIGLQATGPWVRRTPMRGVRPWRAVGGRGPCSVGGGLASALAARTRVGEHHFYTLRALSPCTCSQPVLMCRSGLKLAACYLLGTAYLRSLSLLSLLSRALTLSRPRTQTQQDGGHTQRGTLGRPPPRYLGAHASRSDAVA